METENQLTAFNLDPGIAPHDFREVSEATEVDIASAEDFLTDESRMSGRAERLFLPRCESELAVIMRAAFESCAYLTVSCGRTGITGGAVPMDGWLVSFDRMRKITGMVFDEARNEFRLKCQPGISLDDLASALEKKEFPDHDSWLDADLAALSVFKKRGAHVFPPDPTERTAGLGGIVACNASGARSFYYGAARDYVSRLRLVMMDGAVIDLERGACRASTQGGFQLALPGGEIRRGVIPERASPRVKNAAGYYMRPNMDLIDLFIGSEGTLCVFSEIEIVLPAAPATVLGVLAFFGSEKDAVDFVCAARGECPADRETHVLKERPTALEFFDARSLNLLRERKRLQGAGSLIPALPEDAHSAVYVESAIQEGSDADIEDVAEAMLELLESCGSRSDTAWTALTDEESERLKTFRHALPEAVNQTIGERAGTCPGLTKLGTDFAVPDERLRDLLEMYHSALEREGFDYVVFGHIGDNHLHANILPRDMAEYERGKALYMELAGQVVKWGGTVSGEHGIGKLKKNLLSLMYDASAIAGMTALKKVFDPRCLLNRGNIFDPWAC